MLHKGEEVWLPKLDLSWLKMLIRSVCCKLNVLSLRLMGATAVEGQRTDAMLRQTLAEFQHICLTPRKDPHRGGRTSVHNCAQVWRAWLPRFEITLPRTSQPHDGGYIPRSFEGTVRISCEWAGDRLSCWGCVEQVPEAGYTQSIRRAHRSQRLGNTVGAHRKTKAQYRPKSEIGV